MYIDKTHQPTNNGNYKSKCHSSLFSKLVCDRPCKHHTDCSRKSTDQYKCSHCSSCRCLRIDSIKHPSCVVAHRTILYKSAKLKEQEVKNNDPPIFARYTSFDLLTHRKFFFLNTQLYIFLCDTFSCEKILQKNCQKCYNTQNNHHDSPVVVTCCCINYSVMIYKKETLQKNRNKNTCSNSDCCNSRCI